MSMFSRATQEWILDTLGQSSGMEEFIAGLGVDTLDTDSILEKIEEGMTGDPLLQAKAIEYLSTIEEARAYQVDCALLAALGISPAFVCALLHSFGPYSHTGDYNDDDGESVRGMLLVERPPTTKQNQQIALGFVKHDDEWWLEVCLYLEENILWHNDFKLNQSHEGPKLRLYDYALPQSESVKRQGKRLSEMVSHPILDNFDLKIEKIYEEGSDSLIDITNNLHFLTFSEMAMIKIAKIP